MIVNHKEVNEWLKELGCWEAFKIRRDVLRGTKTYENPGDLYEEALKICPDIIVRDEYANCPKLDKTISETLEEFGQKRGKGKKPKVDPAWFKGKLKSTPRKDAKWVYDNLTLELENIDLSSAPSAGAAGMLIWAQENGANENIFRTQIWAKLMPTKQQLEGLEAFQDDGRKQLELIDRISAEAGKLT